ncbi:hyaluronan-binding protein 2-like [Gymnodraco acuticeps]|uniref:trypsin n=1 Tax=Gymnodraco acuticeps TaxID=8218 RepID=A0A6P8U0G1_GYMAC|nr:hyaluronan-binding protein 2-like [Gymnodraco acuticeps]
MALRVKHSTMLTAGALLICLSALSVHGQHAITLDVMYVDYGYDYTTDSPSVFDVGDWLFDLMEESNSCDPNPCNNAGSCQSISDTEFKCYCPEPYIGNRCQKVRNVCENVRCGRGGNCVLNVKNHPYYECKCRPPYHGTNCNLLPSSVCEPNPCQNGGSCRKGNRRLRCFCPDGYTGRFCEIAPTDCYEGNGETYRGVVSMADGQECLDWHSYFIVSNREDPFTMYSDFTGLEQNNHCRNPDGDDKPWCFTKKDSKLQWAYCNVKMCSGGDTAPPTPLKPVPGSAQFSQCGKSPPDSRIRIHGGIKTSPGAHPWQVSVQIKPKGSNFQFGHYCGGSLLSSCWVLTAAHCIKSHLDYQVVMGGVNISKQEGMDQTIPVIQTIVHENYRSTPEAEYNDIALLKLQVTDSPYCAKETLFVKAVCLPDQAFPAGKECVISGWGATETKKISSQLLTARVLLISDEKCKNLDDYRNVLDSSMFCAGTLQGGIDSCQGDSGGPLVCEKNGTQYISGVVSWGVGCAEKNKPGVYASVHAFTDWIKNNMK